MFKNEIRVHTLHTFVGFDWKGVSGGRGGRRRSYSTFWSFGCVDSYVIGMFERK